MDFKKPRYDPKSYTLEFFGPGVFGGIVATNTCSITVLYKDEVLGVWSICPGIWGVTLREDTEKEEKTIWVDRIA
jgi:hypothetical protein